jgi:hypothetical protein
MTQTQTQNQTQAKQKKEFVPIEIYPETRRLLAIIKAKYGFRSYDELIRHLLQAAGYADQ